MQNARKLPAEQALNRDRWVSWRDLALAALMVMEISWVAPWFRLLSEETGRPALLRVSMVLLGAMLAAHGIIRLLVFLRLRKFLRQGIVLAVAVVSVLLGIRLLLYSAETLSWGELLRRAWVHILDSNIAIPPEFIVLVFVILAWWRGMALARGDAGPSTLREQFWVGLGMYVAYVFVVTLATNQPAPMTAFFVFLFATLVGMTAARIAMVSSLRGGRQAGFNRRWLGGVCAAALLLVGLAFIAAQTGQALTSILHAVWLVITAILAVFLWLAAVPIIFLAALLLERWDLFGDVVEVLAQGFERLMNTGKVLGEMLSSWIERTGILEFLARLGPPLRLVCLGSGMVLLMGGLVIWAVMRLWHEREAALIEEEQPALDATMLLQQLNGMLRKRFDGLRQRLVGRNWRRQQAAERVRQIYAGLMALCARMGTPRPTAVTPLEYEPKAARLFPGQEQDIRLITEAYVRVRYGLLPEDAQEVARIEAAWQHLQKEKKEEK